MTAPRVKSFTPERGETKARLQRCFKEDPFKDGVLEEFCEETSMHGFKFLLPQYEPLMRRIFWFIVLTSFTIITVYQLCKQIQGFLNNPLAVNIEKKYPASITFPVVLLCNTMPFRVSKAHPKSIMHAALSALYSTPKLNVSAAEDYRTTLKSITNTTDYLSHVAFSKRNMIVRCVWQNSEECSPDDFETSFVDNRICYAFNTAKNGNSTRSISQAGESNGLELTLNAETYEEMHGPYTTFGILVGLNDQESTPSASSTIYTMIGASTKIGMKQAEVQYYKGLTCDEKPLKYFSVYSRQACVMEKKIDQVVLNCKCFPFVVSKDYVDLNGTLQPCNLYQHFHCSSQALAEIPTFDSEECPQECHTVSFNPTVSQSVISWTRTRAQFWKKYSTEQNLFGNLANATETSTRYDPEKNSTNKKYFYVINETTEQMVDVMNDVNNLTDLAVDDLFNLPPALPDLPVSESMDEFEQEMLNEEKGIISLLENIMTIVNASVYNMDRVINNASLLPYLFAKREVGNITINKRELPPRLLVVAEGSVFLQLFADWTDAVLSMDKLNIEIDFVEKYVSVPPAWTRLLTSNETSYIIDIQSSLNSVTFLKNNIYNNSGCLYKEYFKFSNNEGQNITVSSAEVFTCVLHHWSGPAAKQAQSEMLPQVLSFIEPEVQEVDAQTKACDRMLCSMIQGENTPDCKLNEIKFKSNVKKLIQELEPLIQSCSDIVENSRMEIEEFIADFRNTTMDTFLILNENMTAYRDQIEGIGEILSEPIWPTDKVLQQILGNISNYQSDYTNMTELANKFTSSWINWKSDELTPTALNAKEKLQNLIDDIEEIEAITDALYTHLNSTHGSNGHSETRIGMFYTLANIKLWGNETEANMQEVIRITEVAKNLSSIYIDNITSVLSAYSNAFNSLLEGSQDFENQLLMDNAFFNRNFLVVNIFFTEVSIDRTVQNRAYDFWSMMSNLGGTCGLWLGFSITTGVEILSLLFRYFMFPFIRWIVDMLDGDLDLLVDAKEKERRRQAKEVQNTRNNANNRTKMENGENFELKD